MEALHSFKNGSVQLQSKPRERYGPAITEIVQDARSAENLASGQQNLSVVDIVLRNREESPVIFRVCVGNKGSEDCSEIKDWYSVLPRIVPAKPGLQSDYSSSQSALNERTRYENIVIVQAFTGFNDTYDSVLIPCKPRGR